MLWLKSIVYSALFEACFIFGLPLSVAASDRYALWRPSVTVAGVGWLLISFGFGAVVVCIAQFARQGHGTPAPLDPPRRLVRTGPYGVVRNPIYVGALLILLGELLLLGSRALIAYMVLYATIIHLVVVLYEEPTLERLFGSEYTAYRSQVGRWLPRLGRSGRGG